MCSLTFRPSPTGTSDRVVKPRTCWETNYAKRMNRVPNVHVGAGTANFRLGTGSKCGSETHESGPQFLVLRQEPLTFVSDFRRFPTAPRRTRPKGWERNA